MEQMLMEQELVESGKLRVQNTESDTERIMSWISVNKKQKRMF